jgi:ADP-ribosylglycohydrolase
MDNLKFDKYLGALLGAAVGDALGWPNEQNSSNITKAVPGNRELFTKWVRSGGGRFWAHEEVIYPGEYSDDTQLIISACRSLQYGNSWSRYFSKIELPAWLSYERGGGGATKRAAEVLKKGGIPWKVEGKNSIEVRKYFEAGGNGVAMRILPHVFGNEEKVEEIMLQVIMNGIFTHGHPRALLGAALYADALVCISKHSGTLDYGELVNILLERKNLWGHFPRTPKFEEWLINADTVLGSSYMQLWDKTIEEIIALLNTAKIGLEMGALDMGSDILEKLGCFDKKTNGSGTVTAAASIYLFSKYASNPVMGLVDTAYLSKADSDTLASMTGALLGMLQGTGWLLPDWLSLQDYEFLRKLLKDIVREDKRDKAYPTKVEFMDVSNVTFKNKLRNLKKGDILAAAPFNLMTVMERVLNKSSIKGVCVSTIKLMSEEGQTIFMKTYGKSYESVEEAENIKIDEVNTPGKDSVGDSEHKTLGALKKNSPSRNQILINANRLRSLVHVLPENMPTDQFLFLISDIMLEIEKSGTGAIPENTIVFIRDTWGKYGITDSSINRIINILLNY